MPPSSCHLEVMPPELYLGNFDTSRGHFRTFAGQVAPWNYSILSIIYLQSLEQLGSSLKMWFDDTVKLTR